MKRRITNTNSLSLEDGLEPDADEPETETLGVPSDPIENVPWFLTHFDEHLLNQVSNHSLNPGFFFHANSNSNSTEKHANVARRWRVRCARRRTQFQDLIMVGTSSSPPPRDNSVSPVSAKRQRRCSHCSTTNTPQWRMGPNGTGTLCNACGIRYRSNPRPFL